MNNEVESNGVSTYFCPLPENPGAFEGAKRLAGGMLRYDRVAVLTRNAPPRVVSRAEAVARWEAAEPALAFAEQERPDIDGIELQRPSVMGVVNVTPDSFSDGGLLANADAAVEHALKLIEEGADVLDIGGESTRPGATPVSPSEEQDRVLPVLEGLRTAGCKSPISIDTRHASTARIALGTGAALFNDVSALSHDAGSIDVAVSAPGVCLMHALGDPRTMQNSPTYNDVLLDVFDYLDSRISIAEHAGIPRHRILVDPGIGFGKTIAHNLALIRGLALLHTLGCGILLGVSRKGFIGKLGDEPNSKKRAPGSIAAALHGLAQGAQIIRVHDVAQTRQAVLVWQALHEDFV